MGSNGSLDFLNMIKSQGSVVTHSKHVDECGAKIIKTVEDKVTSGAMICVIDTETNWRDEVMSLGIALADANSYKCVDKKYYIFEQEARVGGMYSNVMHMRGMEEWTGSRRQAMADIKGYLAENGVGRIFAYNAKFDYNHLPELSQYEWFDIMRIAAYKQYNKSIPENCPTCKTGRLKTNYGVESILRMLSGNERYCEVHNAVCDAVDELKIVELLGHGPEVYECARI